MELRCDQPDDDDDAVKKNLDSLSYMLRVAVSVRMLSDNPEIIRPDVLKSDRDRYEKIKDDPDAVNHLVDRAKRRGKYGWCLGEDYETIPHWRRPHPALVWTEKGRTTPKIIFRRGSIVHRERATKVPTGCFDECGREVED